MTTRIDTLFAALRRDDRAALVTFVTAGDPDAATSLAILKGLPAAGADVIELGMPFTDPMADGPAIQASSQRALRAGQDMHKTLAMVRDFRAGDATTPLVLMGYYNPVYAFGLEAFARTAVDAGVDGVIIVDLPPEEATELAGEADVAGLDVIHLIAPTSTAARLRLIARKSTGFIYLVSRLGVTGATHALPGELPEQLRTLRMVTTKPICVGFGISRPEQVAEVGALADGAVVGSAIVTMIERGGTSSRLVGDVGNFIAELKAPLRK
jgi:tryptophan synthase alpha chain